MNFCFMGDRPENFSVLKIGRSFPIQCWLKTRPLLSFRCGSIDVPVRRNGKQKSAKNMVSFLTAGNEFKTNRSFILSAKRRNQDTYDQEPLH